MRAYIYKKQIIKTKKFYIGKHNGNNKWYKGSGTEWKQDYKLYVKNPKTDIITEILEYIDDLSIINKREKYWLEYFDAANNPCYYNKTNKSYGPTSLSQIAKDKIGQSNKKPNPKKGSSKPKGFKNRTSPSKGKKWKWKDKIPNHILQYDLQGNFIKEWSNIKTAIEITNIKGINECINNRSKTAGGYIWKKFTKNYPLILTKDEIKFVNSRKPIYNKDKNKPFIVMNQNFEIIHEFDSLKEASIILKKEISNISAALSGKKKNYLKLIWKFKN